MNVWIWHIYEIALRGTSRLRLNHPTSWYIHIIHSMPTSRKVWLHYGNGLRSPMKLRKARHLRRCDRPGRCRPSWPLQEPWRSHQIHPSKKGGPGWVAVSNMLVKGGCHEVACVDDLRGINEKRSSKQKMRNPLPLFWSSTFFSVLLISIFKVPFLSRSWTQLDWILVLFSDYRS